MNIKALTIILACNLTGCIQMPVQQSEPVAKQSAEPALDAWLNQTLSPHLVDKLSHHPRFKDRTIVLASLRGDAIQPQTDGLTEHIQTIVKDALLGAPNIKLAWQPTQQANAKMQRLAKLDCTSITQRPIIIGIETGVSDLNQATQIRVRALDTEENIWIPGLSLKWEGNLSDNYVALSQKIIQSAHLKGLRSYPFRATETDLVAGYLAKNLSCLLQNRRFDGELTLYAQPAREGDSAAVAEVVKLIGNNLTKFDEVTMVKDPAKANFILEHSVAEVTGNDDLSILSLSLLKDRDTALKGMETSAYMLSPPTSVATVSHEPLAAPMKSRVAPVLAQTVVKRSRQAQWVEPISSAQVRQSKVQKEFRGADIEQVEQEAFRYAMDYGPDQPRVLWTAQAGGGTKVKGYFQVTRNIIREGSECREFYEEIDRVGSTRGTACRDSHGEWQAND